MATELATVRSKLVPMLFLPLDSQMFEHVDVFKEQDLRAHHLSRRSSCKDVADEGTYRSLQDLAASEASTLAKKYGATFHPIYFDLLWNGRHQRQGSNLFELNPGV